MNAHLLYIYIFTRERNMELAIPCVARDLIPFPGNPGSKSEVG